VGQKLESDVHSRENTIADAAGKSENLCLSFRRNLMSTVRGLNLKHLRYFVEVARRGSVSAAARALFVTPQTVSGQIQELEESIGQPLFDRLSKRLVLTTAGATALDYANNIFALSDELSAVLRSQARPRSLSLRVGITDSVPKLLTVATLVPLIERHRDELELTCQEGGSAELLGRVAAGELDMVLSDATVPSTLARALHVIVLKEDGVSFLAAPSLARRLKGRFPHNLHEMPFLTSLSAHSALSPVLDAWFARQDIRPHVVGRIDDSALLKGFAHSGLGVAAVPTAIERDVCGQYNLIAVGRTDEVRQTLYLVRARVRRPHLLVAELEGARNRK
jgi:LysR family transcriptional regulator, transcriptional activator of nhaA